jgi:FkbM family methyltransferase
MNPLVNRFSYFWWKARLFAQLQMVHIDARLLLDSRYRFSRSIYGPELCDHPEDQTFQLGIAGYGPFIADVITAYDRPFVFLDIGANAGLFSMIANGNELCKRVYAFEPIPASFRNMVINLARNRCSKVVPVCAAIANRTEPFSNMAYNPRHSGMSRFDTSDDAIRVRSMNPHDLDRLVRNDGFAIVAKIDVEGAETEVVAALRKTRFYRHLECMIVEVSARNAGLALTRILPTLLARDGFVEHSRTGAEDHYDALFVRKVIHD